MLSTSQRLVIYFNDFFLHIIHKNSISSALFLNVSFCSFIEIILTLKYVQHSGTEGVHVSVWIILFWFQSNQSLASKLLFPQFQNFYSNFSYSIVQSSDLKWYVWLSFFIFFLICKYMLWSIRMEDVNGYCLHMHILNKFYECHFANYSEEEKGHIICFIITFSFLSHNIFLAII